MVEGLPRLDYYVMSYSRREKKSFFAGLFNVECARQAHKLLLTQHMGIATYNRLIRPRGKSSVKGDSLSLFVSVPPPTVSPQGNSEQEGTSVKTNFFFIKKKRYF